MEQIPHSKPWITALDIAAVSEALSSPMLAQGERTRALEQRLAAWLNSVDGVAVASGSAGMVLALHGLMIGAGDEVVIPTYVCRSVYQAILAVGATPVLADVGKQWLMTPEEAQRAIRTKTRAIIVPHLYGIFADVGAFLHLGVPVIEDSAQALAAPGQHTAVGDVSVFSFHPTKCLTSGEGGMAISSNPQILQRMRDYRDGCNDVHQTRLFSPLSDISASLALSQLDHYEQALVRRREIASSYICVIEACCPDLLNRVALEASMYFRFPLCVPGGLDACGKAFANFGVQVRRGLDVLLHRRVGQNDQMFPVAARLFDTTISLPIYPALSRSEESRCLEAIVEVLPHLNWHLLDSK